MSDRGRGFTPPQRRRVHEEIAEQLRDAILDGVLVPGSKLPPERELAAQFEVNRNSLREAIKVLEGLGLISVRQGDGATVLPCTEGSLDLLAPMIYRKGQIDSAALLDVVEVIRPLLLEMSKLALERHQPEQIEEIRRLRDIIADESVDRELRFAAGRDVIVELSDMTRNRVWQMLARRTRDLLAAPALVAVRTQLDRDPCDIAPIIDRCTAAIEAREPEAALDSLRAYVQYLSDLALCLHERDGSSLPKAS